MLHLKEVAYEDNLLETHKHWTVEGAGKLRDRSGHGYYRRLRLWVLYDKISTASLAHPRHGTILYYQKMGRDNHKDWR